MDSYYLRYWLTINVFKSPLKELFDTLLTDPATVMIGNRTQIEAVQDQFDVIKEFY